MRLFTDAGRQAVGLFESVIEIFFGGSQEGVMAPVTYHQQPEALAALAASRARRESRSGGNFERLGYGTPAHTYAAGHIGTPSVTEAVFSQPTTQGGSQSFGGVITVQKQGSPAVGYVTQSGKVSGAPPSESPITEEQQQRVVKKVFSKRGAGTILR